MSTDTITALIIVDMQNDFITGSLATDPENTLSPRLASYLNGMYDFYDVIVTTQDWHKDPGSHWAQEGQEPDFKDTWPVHCAADTHGAEIEEGLEAMLETIEHTPVHRFYKGQYDASYSGFDGKDSKNKTLADYLHEHMVDNVEIVGIATDFCVKATAEDAVKNGFNTAVLRDFVQGVDPKTSEELLDHGFNSKNISVY